MNSPVFKDLASIQNAIRDYRSDAQSISFVPTLGGIHEGHLSLIRIAAMKSEKIIVSIFLNSKQFNDKNDLKSYPKNFQIDKKLIDQLELNTIIYAPAEEEIYPQDFDSKISLPSLENKLCGEFRPNHFSSVATIVVKLLLQILPDYAVFGGKDFQQLRIIRQVCKDLNVPTHIIGAPTVRNNDGLALSSRNLLLSPEQLKIAPLLYQNIKHIAHIAAKQQNITQTCIEAENNLINAGFHKVDYIGMFDVNSLDKINLFDKQTIKPPPRVFARAGFGNTYLIDNVGIIEENQE